MYLRNSEDASVAGGNGGINIMWVSWTTLMTLTFINMRNCCGFLANKECDLIYIVRVVLPAKRTIDWRGKLGSRDTKWEALAVIEA